ncbi:phosphotransferase [Chitinivorax sp. B]|uniref:aminoglycoside phosphotransferase family protein n=1 Tax=Chitinivorax sp. B TaxID=2502235 RepID=UPI0010F9696C|nr:phosphotransferase [Chitinivorax sp. B]
MQRKQQIESWLADLFPGQSLNLVPASEDASQRRYFRTTLDDGSTRIIMDAPPAKEDCRPFIQIREVFANAGVHVPMIYAQDLAQGFLLLEDFGTTMYQDVLNADTMRNLYLDAIDAMINIQLASRPGVLPDYDEAFLAREIDIFQEWYLPHEAKLTLSTEQQGWFDNTKQVVLKSVLAQPKVFVHRDFHSRNLMVCKPNPGIIDFQGALYGPLAYDLMSLLKDAYLEWEEEQVLDLVIRYWERARKVGLPVPPDVTEFYKDFEMVGVQRQLKVVGIFARLAHRDGKTGYLIDLPRVWDYLRKNATRYIQLKPLLKLMDEIEGRQPQVGYTF